jgi:hypothetical protein
VFGGGGFRGWRRKRKRNMLLLGFLLIFGLGLLLCLISEGVWRRRLSWVEKEKEEKHVAGERDKEENERQKIIK